MAGLPHAELEMVMIAKHLCGVATDLSLRAILTRARASSGGHESDGSGGGEIGGERGERRRSDDDPAERDMDPGKGFVAARHGVAGVCVASCCHHCCDWDDYVAKGYTSGDAISLVKSHTHFGDDFKLQITVTALP